MKPKAVLTLMNVLMAVFTLTGLVNLGISVVGRGQDWPALAIALGCSVLANLINFFRAKILQSGASAQECHGHAL